MMMIVLITEAVLQGMKLTFAWNAWKGRTVTFTGIFKERLCYLLSAIMAVVNLLAWYGSSQNLAILVYADLMLTYLVLAAVDIRHQIVPDRVLACFAMSQLFYGICRMPVEQLGAQVLTGAIVLALLSAGSLLSKGKFGLGDAKLLGVTAAFTGIGYLFQMMFFGMIAAFFYCIFLLVTKRATVKSEFPFVPFLAIGILFELLPL